MIYEAAALVDCDSPGCHTMILVRQSDLPKGIFTDTSISKALAAYGWRTNGPETFCPTCTKEATYALAR